MRIIANIKEDINPRLFSKALTDGQKEDKGVIGIDFDGVIHRYSKGWQDGSIYDKPIEGTDKALTELLDKGYKLFIFTARPLKGIREWLKSNFEDERIHNINLTNKKLPAQLYIDDRGYRFKGWGGAMNFVEKGLV